MDDNREPFPELGSVYKKAGQRVDWLSQSLAHIKLDSTQNQDITAKAFSPQNSAFSAWGRPNLIQKLGIRSTGNAWTVNNADFRDAPDTGNAFQFEQKNNVENRWDFLSAPKVGSPQFNGWNKSQQKDDHMLNSQVVWLDDNESGSFYDNDDGEIVFDSSDNDDADDDFDSDTSEKSHDTRKKSKWFRAFFNVLDELTIEEIISPSRQWHCPACRGGPGSIDWYRGVEPLMNHAKTKKKRRAKLHRVFAEILNEEMRRRRILITTDSEASGRWEGLNEKVKDYEIVWPPMVVIMNTRYEQEENGKWIGMGNRELLNHFRSYAALKARHSYGPQGHRGISMLIFEGSAAGYFEAIRLHKHFKEQGRDKNAWDHNRVPFCPGGKRQLYGYMALKEDLDIFNQHCQGRSMVKFEMKSYHEMVEKQIRKIDEDNQLLVKFKNKVSNEQKQTQALTASLCTLTEKMCMITEKFIEGQQTVLLHDQNEEEVNSSHKIFKDQIRIIHQAIDDKDDKFEKLQLVKREKVKQSHVNPSTTDDAQRDEDIDRFIKLLDKEMEEFEAEKERLLQSHASRKAAIVKRYWEDQLESEKEFENELTKLMKKYTSDDLEVETSNGHQFKAEGRY